MKKFKGIISIILGVLLLTSMMSLVACGNEGDTTYKVTVKDALGNPYTSGVIVQFMQGDKQVAIQTVDENGVAAKKLASGKYTIAMKFADEADCYFDDNLQVTASDNEIDVVLSRKIDSEPRSLYANGADHDAYSVEVGCTYADFLTDKRNYFLFTPRESGNYEITVVDNPDTQIGYYGSTHFVQDNSVAEVVDNKFTITIADSMIGSGEGGTSVIVIGVDVLSGGKAGGIISINRVGDAGKTLSDEPWTVYEKSVELKEYKLPEGGTIKEFNLTAETSKYNLVFNETDGFYHLNSADGPVVLVRLAEDCQYINCFKSMLDRSGVVKYFFDDNGEFIKKESYTECLLEYIEYVDESEGVYPLTEDLKYIIQQRGEYAQWWDFESSNFRFQDINGKNMPEINTEIAWLLMCCYVE